MYVYLSIVFSLTDSLEQVIALFYWVLFMQKKKIGL